MSSCNNTARKRSSGQFSQPADSRITGRGNPHVSGMGAWGLSRTVTFRRRAIVLRIDASTGSAGGTLRACRTIRLTRIEAARKRAPMIANPTAQTIHAIRGQFTGRDATGIGAGTTREAAIAEFIAFTGAVFNGMDLRVDARNCTLTSHAGIIQEATGSNSA